MFTYGMSIKELVPIVVMHALQLLNLNKNMCESNVFLLDTILSPQIRAGIHGNVTTKNMF